MNIHLENVNLNNNSGPNSFGQKLLKYMGKMGHTFDRSQEGNVALAFIQSDNLEKRLPLVQRLDGIYFNTIQNYRAQNYFIEETYKKADGVIFQSDFNKRLTFAFFGPHDNYTVIHNGADVEGIDKTEPANIPERFSEIWCCASFWRPHKRLNDNIKYFLEYSPRDACLVVAGKVNEHVHDPRVFYIGEISQSRLYSLYKASTHLIHLAWLDHCPNVVVDARACGCKIICSSSGGTREIAGREAIVIEEKEWDFQPVNLYTPPEMDFSKQCVNYFDTDFSMNKVAEKYYNFLSEVRR